MFAGIHIFKVMSCFNRLTVSGLTKCKKGFCTASQAIQESKVKSLIVHKARCNEMTIDPQVEKALEEGTLKHRKHPGSRGSAPVTLPKRLLLAAEKVIRQSEHSLKVIKRDARTLRRQMDARQLPATDREVRTMKKQVANQMMLKDGIDTDLLDPETQKSVLASRKQSVRNKLDSLTCHWKPSEFNTYKCLLYLYGCFAPNYGSLYKIFQEIQREVPDFQPKTLFDFGSGVGSTLWAAKEIFQGSVSEAFCVDCSHEMNDLARLLLQDGEPEAEPWISNVFFKPFVPPSNLVKYELVVCAHALMDTPTAKERIRIINNLWNKTEDMMVIVEHGSYVGHSLVIEARDYILERFNGDQEKKQAFVVAPCPHERPCPKMKTTKNIPCSFPLTVQPMSFEKTEAPESEKYSYAVLTKKRRKEDDAIYWPRIISPLKIRSRHLICELCNTNGHLYETIFSKKRNGRHIYRCARGSNWGDLIPATLIIANKDSDVIVDETSSDSDEETSSDESEVTKEEGFAKNTTN